MRYFPVAPMSKMLKITSLLGSVLLLIIAYQAKLAVPPISVGEFTHFFGLGVVALLPAIWIGSLLFVVRGYSIDRRHLYIHRLFWKTALPLKGLHRIEFAPDHLKCSMRLFGNGGLFAFTGLYKNKTIGRYRLFATDFACAVTLFLNDRTIVITPAQPLLFVNYIQTNFLGSDDKNFFATRLGEIKHDN
jgi:hypothetical protein